MHLSAVNEPNERINKHICHHGYSPYLIGEIKGGGGGNMQFPTSPCAKSLFALSCHPLLTNERRENK